MKIDFQKADLIEESLKGIENYQNIRPEKEMSIKELTEAVKGVFYKAAEVMKDGKENLELAKDKIIFDPDHKECLSTSKERIEFAKHSKGEWSGIPGDSLFIPDKREAQEGLKKYKQDGIVYKDGEPDFRKVSEATVKIKDMTSDRPYNFRQADEACAKLWNDNKRENRSDWTARDVNKWRKDNRYSWHERLDMKSMDLVQRDVHEECKHYGGVSECKKREGLSGGSFDE